jgi:hypothetical protein
MRNEQPATGNKRQKMSIEQLHTSWFYDQNQPQVRIHNWKHQGAKKHGLPIAPP